MVVETAKLGVREQRLAEVLALLPMLHVPRRDSLTVVVSGKLAPGMASEVQRWPDVKQIIVAGHPAPKEQPNKRLRFTDLPAPACADLVLLSPEDDPRPLLASLRRGGVINVTTFDETLWGPVVRKMKADIGSATPYREYLPLPIYGVLGRLGGSPTRVRQPPASAKRLHSKYLPNLFCFGKDEITLLNPPRNVS